MSKNADTEPDLGADTVAGADTEVDVGTEKVDMELKSLLAFFCGGSRADPTVPKWSQEPKRRIYTMQSAHLM